MFMFKKSPAMPRSGEALPGRAAPIATASKHFLNGNPLKGPYPEGAERAMFDKYRERWEVWLVS